MNKNGDEKSKLHILIGRNGTGKSRMLSSLLKHELKKSYSKDSQSFSRFIAVSIAPFDKFPISLNDFFGKYKYLGIKNTSGSTAAKKFIKKVGVDFFEMLASGGNLFHLNKSLTDFGLDPRVEFEMKVSSKVNNPKVNYLNNNEY